MLGDLLNLNIHAFFLIFARVGTALMMMPGFGAAYVAVRARLLLAMAITFAVTPVIAPNLPPMPAAPIGQMLMIAGEVVIGAFLGAIVYIMLAALQTAGTVISLHAAQANALIQDPVSQQQSSIIAGFLTTLGILLIFVTNTHYMLLRAVVDSYTLFVPGRMPMFGDFSQMLARTVADSFALGVQLAMPVVVVALTYFIGVGLLTRLMPQLHIFFFGLPVQILTQIAVLMLILSSIMMVFLSHFDQTISLFEAP